MIDIWIWVHHRDGTIEASTHGLATEAGRLISELGDDGLVTAVACGSLPETEFASLGAYGVNRVLHFADEGMQSLQGEQLSLVLYHTIQSTTNPALTCLLAAQTAEIEDLFPRLAALMNSELVTRAVDFHMEEKDKKLGARAIRPIADGYLFEELTLECQAPPLVSFLPSVLFDTKTGSGVVKPDGTEKNILEIITISPELKTGTKTRLTDRILADPENMDLEDADIIVAGGRGVGKADSFDIIHKLARVIGGTVGATRPIIDRGILPYERQIGQTGKYVTPNLIINCGISGANEYTAGIEKSQKVIAIDQNPRARIFRFADLGVVGDLNEILPMLVSRIEELKQ